MGTKKVRLDEIAKLKGKTDKKEFDELSDEDIEGAAKEDPDSALPTEDELREFEKVGIKDKPRKEG